MLFVWTLWIMVSAACLKAPESAETSSSRLTALSAGKASDGLTSSPTSAVTSDGYPFSVSFSSETITTEGPSSTSSAAAPTTPHGKIKCDLYCCNCNGPKARCTGQNRSLTYLPRVPANIRDFRMMRADLANLTRLMMANLSNFDIQLMNLTCNKVVHITPDAFADFVHMKILDLSGNPMASADLQSSLRGIGSKSLLALALWDMGLPDLPDDFFDLFYNMTFRYVDLHKNYFTTFNSALFAPFWSAETVDLSGNRIASVNMSARIDVDHLVLKSNRLKGFPDFCLKRSADTGQAASDISGFYNLQSLYILNNPISEIEKIRGACLPQLIKLDIGQLPLTRLRNNFISDLPKLSQLLFYDMRTHRIGFDSFALNSSSLQTLKMMQNPRFDPETVDVNNMFRYCPRLETLYIVDVKFDLNQWQIYHLLKPLTSLKELMLHQIRRGFLPPDLLSHMPRLETLMFTGNNLYSEMLGKALTNVTSLKYLNVQANRIAVVNETILPWEVRRSLKTLDISLNPFACTCELRWFRNWLGDVYKNKSVRVHNYPYHEYYCNTPPNLKNTLLSSFYLTEDDCAVKNPLILVGIVGGSLLVFLVGLFLVGYRYRWHWRFYLYRIRRRHKYIQVPGGVATGENEIEFFRFDAYLAHSAQDLDWIMDELLPIIEGEHGLRVFLEERDSIPGTVIADSITQHMDESARILLLISDSYNREGWRQCEFEHILFAAVEQQKDVIIVLLGDVEAGRMTRDMRRMLTRGTFLQWGNSEEARRVFRNGLKLALKTQNANLQSLC